MDNNPVITEEPLPGWLRYETEGEKPWFRTPVPRMVIRDASKLKFERKPEAPAPPNDTPAAATVHPPVNDPHVTETATQAETLLAATETPVEADPLVETGIPTETASQTKATNAETEHFAETGLSETDPIDESLSSLMILLLLKY